MRTCQSCGLQNPPDRDFCECGEYLRWEPTAIVSAITPEVAAKAAAEAEAEEPAAPEAAPSPVDPPPPAAAPERSQYVEAVPPPRVSEAPAATPRSPGNGHGVTSDDPLGGPTAPPPTGPKGTQIMGAVPASVPVPAPPPEPDEPELATITLRLPDKDSDKEHTLATAAEPGQRERILALVRNQSGIVDNYKLAIDGLPAEWWSIYPDTVYLVPFGSGGTYEQEVEIHLHPPRTPKAEAKLWGLKVVAHSKANETTAAAAPFGLAIKPYVDTTTKVRPERKKGRRRADYDVTVENKANAPVLIALEGEDPDAELAYGFNRPPTEIPPGQTVQTSMRVRPPKQLWIGRPQERRFSVITLTGEQAAQRLAAEPTPAEELKGRQTHGIAKSGWFGRAKSGDLPGAYGPRVYKPQVYAPGVNVGPGGISFRKPQFQAPQLQAPQMKGMNFDANQLKDKVPGMGGAGGSGSPPPMGPLLPSQAVFRQKPWLPWWLIPVVIALAALAVMLYLLLPKNELVPDVVGKKSAFEAEKALTKANLKLNPDKKIEVNTKVPPGTVVKQDPPAGKKAEKDSLVAIVTAVGTGRLKVPDLKGKTITDAEKALRAGKLTLGQATPQPDDPAGFLVKSQIPAAGEVAKEGEPVNVFVIKAPAKAKAGKGATAKQKAAAAAAAQAAVAKATGAGKTDITIPAVDGAKLDAYAAKLSALKLVPQKKLAYDASNPGTVFKTDPAAGHKAKAGQTVTLFVSGGFPEVAYDDDKDILVRDGATGKPLKPIATSLRQEKDPTFSDDGTHLAYQAANQVFLADLSKPDAAPRPLTAKDDLFSDLQFAPTPERNLLSMLRDNADGSRQLCLQVVAKTVQAPQCLDKPPGGIFLDRKINWSNDGKQMLVTGYVLNASDPHLTPTKIGMVRYRSKKAFSPDSKDWHTSGFATDVTNKGKGVLDAAFSPDGKTIAVVSNLNAQGTYQLSLAKPDDLPTLSKAKALGVSACKVVWRPDGIDVVVIAADDCLGARVGQLRRIAVANPKTDQDQLALIADNPTFQPLKLGG